MSFLRLYFKLEVYDCDFLLRGVFSMILNVIIKIKKKKNPMVKKR